MIDVMELCRVELWSLWLACGLMGLAAVLNAGSLRVPNWLALTGVMAGLVAGVLVSSHVGVPSQGGGIVASLAGLGVGFAVLAPLYLMGGLGAGCVKMQMAFGAWVGYAVASGPAAKLVGLGTVAAIVCTLIGAAVQAQMEKPSDPTDVRRGLFPAQVTMSLGSIAGVVAALLAGWVQMG